MNILSSVIVKAIPEQIQDWQQPLSTIEIDEYVRKATLTEWFVNPVKGQPRYVDIYRLRAFGKSEWISAVTSYLQSRVKIVDYEITAKNPKKRDKPSLRLQNEIRKAEKLFDSCTPNGESFKQGVEAPLLRDVLELDSGVLVKVFTKDSYSGDPKNMGSLKPSGERLLAQFHAIDGGSLLKDIGVHYVLKGYWQYSYTRPTSAPAFFDPDEICYVSRYPRSYSCYGWSPIQNADAILNSLVNSAVWNANFFSNQGIPRGMITLLNADDKDVKRFRNYWRQKVKGRWYELPVTNRDAKWVPFAMNAKDMEWLSGQKWYQRLVCALYQVNISEIGLEDTSRRAGSATETTERLQKRSSIVPLLTLIEDSVNKSIISEISPRIMFRYVPLDPEEQRLKATADNAQIELGLKTINEIRDERGEQPVSWGNWPPSLLNNLIRSFSRLGHIPEELVGFEVEAPPSINSKEFASDVALAIAEEKNRLSPLEREKIELLKIIRKKYGATQ